jgi:hypothetical protein
VSRTEELRVLDERRAELATQLDLSRVRENELKVALDEAKHAREQDQAQAAEESQKLRELLRRQSEKADVQPRTAPAENGAERHSESHVANNPVLASVMEQFGKLRQQRAQDRPALKKGR